MAQAVVPILAVAGTAMSAYGSYSKGRAADSAAQFEAGQMRDNAARTAESGIKRAEEIRRQQRVALSDARAAQASSGGSTTDAGALLQQGNLAGAFERNALEELYQSGLDSRAMLTQAAARKAEGKSAKRAGTIAALATALEGGTSIYNQYGTDWMKMNTMKRPKATPAIDGMSSTRFAGYS